MGALRALSGAELIEILSANGFVRVRQKGSHVAMQLKFTGGTRTVVVPLHNRRLKPGTLGKIIAQSKLPRALFEVD
jgi:predicted RNA binding protein YcfA (HicA-like mRNA interferase family)